MITNATHAQLLKNGKRALNPAQLNSYLPWQKAHDPRFRYTEDAMISWVEGEFYDGRKVFLPAAAVFWNFDYRHDANEPVLVESTTNGAGAHFTREGAILSGVLENIQRDGFLVYWMNGISPRHIDVADIQDEASRDVLARLARYGIEAHFLNTTSDIAVPSVTCALVDRRTDTPVLSIGAGTGFTLEETIASSALESLAVMHYTMDLPEFHLPKDYKPFLDSSVGQNQRRSLWKGKEMLEKFSFFLSGEKQSLEDFQKQLPDLSTEQERLTYVTNLLKQKGEGYELYVYDVHNEVLDALHYHVVRTLVPRLVPLYLQENYALLDSARLREVPQLLGYEVTKTFNPAPHPFP